MPVTQINYAQDPRGSNTVTYSLARAGMPRRGRALDSAHKALAEHIGILAEHIGLLAERGGPLGRLLNRIAFWPNKNGSWPSL